MSLIISRTTYSAFQIDELHRHNQNLVGTLHKGVPTVVEQHEKCCKVSGDGDKDILKGLFECKNYEEHKKKFYIVKPSKVSSQGSQKKWKLVEKGALNFE